MQDAPRHVRLDLDGPIATITLDRPEARNAYSEARCEQLVAALHADDLFADVRCVALTSRILAVDAALRLGLVHEVVAFDLVLARARALALTIAAHPPMVVQRTKRAAHAAQHQEQTAALELAANHQGIVQNLPDHRRALGE